VARPRWNDALLRFEPALSGVRPHQAVDCRRDIATPEAQQALIDGLSPALGDRPR
jgi:hypothetical protein